MNSSDVWGLGKFFDKSKKMKYAHSPLIKSWLKKFFMKNIEENYKSTWKIKKMKNI